MTRRDEAIATLQQGHDALGELFAKLPDDAFALRGTIGEGGGWSAKDLAAHMGLWEAFAIETIDELGHGETPSVTAWYDRPGAGDRANVEGERRFLDMPAAEVRARFEDLHARLVDAIGSMSDEAWTAAYPDEEDPTVGDLIGALTGAEDGRFRHAFDHLDDLRAYVDRR